jgi:hypothetical protein
MHLLRQAHRRQTALVLRGVQLLEKQVRKQFSQVKKEAKKMAGPGEPCDCCC